MFPWKPDHVALKKLLNFHDVIYGLDVNSARDG
jgi:hypothetical protein